MTKQKPESVPTLAAILKEIGVEPVDECVIQDEPSIAEMVENAVELPRRGTVFFLVPPAISDLKAALRLVGKIELLGKDPDVEKSPESPLFDLYAEVGRRILWVKDNGLRRASRQQIDSCFHPLGLARLVMQAIVGTPILPAMPESEVAE